MPGRWYKCKGCGQLCGLLDNGGIAHAKPKELVGVYGRVPCVLYQQCETREFFLELMAGEPIEAPSTFEPLLG